MRGRGRKARRLVLIGTAGGALALAAALVFFALGDRITYAPTPTELAEGHVEAGTRIRLGGLVEEGSVERGADGAVSFAVTDTVNRVAVTYVGILPDLFREGQGVVAEGIFEPSGHLAADTVLARHDETYMPKEVVDSLKAQGRWQEGENEAGMIGTTAPAAPANDAPGL
ncbi:cytochrome c maturation protein CcmE [Acuticoccus sp. M5D2P5]|uniref:cytochrome c maturation protein CcmE n=1 Tax=Acuticoccus kalidii TaxID=2910977 RepID=UPI001F48DD0C|nr:cytochrome c maturation protein CcmE [Acuticoccus kalidii]MCF3935090.1 cytochrome c maturation protein CcmE [Acuticoccus kalidii]